MWQTSQVHKTPDYRQHGEGGSSNGEAFDYGLDGPGSIPGVGGVEIFPGPGVYSASCKMSTGGFP